MKREHLHKRRRIEKKLRARSRQHAEAAATIVNASLDEVFALITPMKPREEDFAAAMRNVARKNLAGKIAETGGSRCEPVAV